VPAFTINADLAPHQGGAHVHVFIDGQRAGSMGPFKDWNSAQCTALELTDDVAVAVRAVLQKYLEEHRDK
jgi:hypothetical protein